MASSEGADSSSSEKKSTMSKPPPMDHLNEFVQIEPRDFNYFMKKCWSEPIVPIGTLATVTCLFIGLRALKNGNKVTQSRAMKGRVIFQGVTAIAVMFGIVQKMQNRKENPVPTLEQTLMQKLESVASGNIPRK
jgi:hypothetical protein